MEPFTVTLNGKKYEVTPYARSYGVSFHVQIDNSQVTFELDEEDNLRALTDGEPLKPEVIAQLAEAITKHFA